MADRGKGAVVITGASSGIGRAAALLLDRSGYRVFAGVRDDGAELREKASPSLTPLKLDVTEDGQIGAAREAVEGALPPGEGLAGLVNNAGIVVSGPLECLPVESLRRQLEVDVIGHVALTQAFLPLLRKARGRILNVGTAGWRLAPPFLGPYIASKCALEGLTHTLRRELRPWGIHVVMVVPGPVETPFWPKSLARSHALEEEFPPGSRELYADRYARGRALIDRMRRRALTAEAAAKVVRRALEARRPGLRYHIGAAARVSALAAMIVPGRLGDWITEKLLPG